MALPQRAYPEAPAPAPPSARRRLADAVAEVLGPAPIAAVLLLLVAWRSAPTATEALAWGAIAALFACLLPLAYVIRGVRRRRFTDRHVRVRTQRPLPLLVGIGSVLVGLGLLSFLGAPRELVALVAAMAAGLAVALLVTLFWKVSVHAAVIAGALVVLVLVFGPWSLLLGPLVALVGWSRVESGDHSVAQVIVGTVLGVAVAGTVFPLLR